MYTTLITYAKRYIVTLVYCIHMCRVYVCQFCIQDIVSLSMRISSYYYYKEGLKYHRFQYTNKAI